MLYTCAEDFFKRVLEVNSISRQEEIELALKMKEGSKEAEEALIISYLPLLASYLKRYSNNPSLELIYRGLDELYESVRNFDFQIENHTFSRFFGIKIKGVITGYIADAGS